MERIIKHLKNNYKIIIAFILGVVISGGGVYAAVVITSKEITYEDNTSIGATNVQDAIDKLNTKATTKIAEAKKECPDGYDCIAKLSDFSKDSWSTIADKVRLKSYPYKIGDTKIVNMGDLGTHRVRVANTSGCTNGETSETACGFVVEFADIISEHIMNTTSINVGGWPASAMRTYVNTTVYNALPSDLQNVIATTKVISGHGQTSGEANFTSSDKLYLFSTKEIYGKTDTAYKVEYDTAETETRQLDYYKNKGITTSNSSGVIKQYNESNTSFWLRSAYANNTYYFFLSSHMGSWNFYSANGTKGVSPAFRIA